MYTYNFQDVGICKDALSFNIKIFTFMCMHLTSIFVSSVRNKTLKVVTTTVDQQNRLTVNFSSSSSVQKIGGKCFLRISSSTIFRKVVYLSEWTQIQVLYMGHKSRASFTCGP